MESEYRPEQNSNLPYQPIPARIVLGVTGHRDLNVSPSLINAIQKAIETIKQMCPPLQNTPVMLSILSPLAEGADRMVAWEIIKSTPSTLEVILPLGKEDYKLDFQTEQSKTEFEELLAKACSIKTIVSKGNRNEAYEKVGHYIVDHCDVLIALWNGKPSVGQGGTQEIVKYARDTQCPLIWIDTNNPEKVSFELGRGLNQKQLLTIDKYNSERFDFRKFSNKLEEFNHTLESIAERVKLPFDNLKSTSMYFLRHYVRADLLSLNYQRQHYRSETLVCILALLAVIVATFQILFVPQQPVILVSEIFLMLAILAIFFIRERRAWHNKWMDYRFLAERFRSSLFMALTSIDIEPLRPPRHLSLAYSPKDWIVSAFISVWNQRPRPKTPLSNHILELSNFINEAWIQDQIGYHTKSRKQHYRRYYLIGIASYGLFILTICAVSLHIASIGSHFVGNLLAFIAIVFPAIATSILAIRTHRDYLRNSMRSAEMVRHLEELKDKTEMVQDYQNFTALMDEIEETMIRENEDWRVVVKFRKPEIHA